MCCVRRHVLTDRWRSQWHLRYADARRAASRRWRQSGRQERRSNDHGLQPGWWSYSSMYHVALLATVRAWLSMLWHCWLGVGKSIWPVKNWVMRCGHGYLSGAWCKWFAYGPGDATAIHRLLFHRNPEWFNLSGAILSRLSWKKRPLNGCLSVSLQRSQLTAQ